MPVPCGGPGRARRAGVRRGAVHRLFALRAEVLRGRADDAGADRARGGGAKGMLTHAVMNRSLLIENGTLLSTGGAASLRRGHSVLIEGGVITRVAPRERMGRFSGRRVDAAGKVVIPGLINGHTHFYGAFARGLTGTKPARDFLGVLRNLWWRLDSALTTEDCYYSALVALIDSIRHGATTVIDHHSSPGAVGGSLDAIACAVRETGLRGCLCYEVSDRDGARVMRERRRESAQRAVQMFEPRFIPKPAKPLTLQASGS